MTACALLPRRAPRMDSNQTTVNVYAPFFPSRERKRPVLNPALALGARIIRNTRCKLPLCVLSGLCGA